MTSSSIAVLLPTRNRIKMLRRTLASLQRQDFRDFTVYVSDNGSTDDTKNFDVSEFADLRLQVLHRTGPVLTIAQHYTALFYETKEPIACLAHDDEVYHPEWLSRLSGAMEDGNVVLAFGQTIFVDAKTSELRFYRGAKVAEGIFTHAQLLENLLLGNFDLTGNGFAVRSSALVQVAPLDEAYEQYDYEWLARLAAQGLTRVLPQFLGTYTVHGSNMLGSRQYLAELMSRKSANIMRKEWLAGSQVNPPQRAELESTLAAHEAGLQWACFLKLLAHRPKLARVFLERYQSYPKAARKRIILGRVLLWPGLWLLAKALFALARRWRARRPMRSRADLILLSSPEALSLLPSLALLERAH